LLATRGAKVVINYLRNQEAAQQVIDEIKEAGGEAIALRANVQESEQVRELVAKTLEAYGHIDILVSNAPTNFHPKPIVQLSWEEFFRPVEGELKAAFELTKAVVPSMIERHYGRLIYTASNMAKQPTFPGGSAVGTAKAGLIAFVKYIAQELGPHGITANSVSPSMVETDLSSRTPVQVRQQLSALTPLRRIAQPEDIARVIAFYADDDSRFMTGTTSVVSGGMLMD
jgi:3-oxoacyl-[acyl-carrier protein] reductase